MSVENWLLGLADVFLDGNDVFSTNSDSRLRSMFEKVTEGLTWLVKNFGVVSFLSIPRAGLSITDGWTFRRCLRKVSFGNDSSMVKSIMVTSLSISHGLGVLFMGRGCAWFVLTWMMDKSSADVWMRVFLREWANEECYEPRVKRQTWRSMILRRFPDSRLSLTISFCKMWTTGLFVASIGSLSVTALVSKSNGISTIVGSSGIEVCGVSASFGGCWMEYI